ncbi:MAG: GntR family transcriptional regulator [Hyphomicrobiales bacterium]
MSDLTDKPRRSLVDYAYEKIRARIFEGEWTPGYQALEEAIARDLEVSRTPVREALIRLEREGLVEILPRKGMQVIAISADDMREVYEVVAVLESEAAARIARMQPNKDYVAPLQNAVDQMEEALRKDNLMAWAKADDAFHVNLLALCGNSRLAEMGMTVQDRVKGARVATIYDRPVPHRSNDDHQALIEAMLSGDVEAARRIHTQHKLNAMNLITSILENKEKADG